MSRIFADLIGVRNHNASVDRDFFAGTRINSNFICCLGYGKQESLYPRNPRLPFEAVNQFA